MQTWIHFIGKKYYTQHQFATEAKAQGITRRVGLHTLEKMRYGDRVLLAMLDGQTPVIFGMFHISVLSGLPGEVLTILKERFLDYTVVDTGGHKVERGCGEYVQGFTIHIPRVEIHHVRMAIATYTDRTGEPVKPMVGGQWQEHQTIRLKDVPFTRGFRTFDYRALMDAVDQWDGSPKYKYPTVKGLFYVWKESQPPVEMDMETQRLIQEVKQYQLN